MPLRFTMNYTTRELRSSNLFFYPQAVLCFGCEFVPELYSLIHYFLLERRIGVLCPFRLFSLDIILRAGFGLDAQVQTDPDPKMVVKALTVLETPVYVRAMSVFPFYKQAKEFFDLGLSQHSLYFMALAQCILEKRKISSTGRRDLFQLMKARRN